jgi:hypothetical protein
MSEKPGQAEGVGHPPLFDCIQWDSVLELRLSDDKQERDANRAVSNQEPSTSEVARRKARPT